MDEYSVDVLPGEVLAWVRADVARMVPRLSVRAAKSYWIDEVSSGESAKPAEGDDVSPVMVRGVMELTPQQGRAGLGRASRGRRGRCRLAQVRALAGAATGPELGTGRCFP
jgi:hypothetical protein